MVGDGGANVKAAHALSRLKPTPKTKKNQPAIFASRMLPLLERPPLADVRHGSWGGGGPTAEVRQVLVNAGSAAVAAVRVFNVNALGVPDCDHSYSCIVVMRKICKLDEQDCSSIKHGAINHLGVSPALMAYREHKAMLGKT